MKKMLIKIGISIIPEFFKIMGGIPSLSMLEFKSPKPHRTMTNLFPRSPEMQATWNDLMGQMCVFVNDTNADIDMAYDWVCEMLEIVSFVDNEAAWDSFYYAWASCDNRNDLSAYIISV